MNSQTSPILNRLAIFNKNKSFVYPIDTEWILEETKLGEGLQELDWKNLLEYQVYVTGGSLIRACLDKEEDGDIDILVENWHSRLSKKLDERGIVESPSRPECLYEKHLDKPNKGLHVFHNKSGTHSFDLVHNQYKLFAKNNRLKLFLPDATYDAWKQHKIILNQPACGPKTRERCVKYIDLDMNLPSLDDVQFLHRCQTDNTWPSRVFYNK